tara:strand:- start:732 stop:1025 length:294 start_codon:yes stop_codon:yes gene_type:complete
MVKLKSLLTEKKELGSAYIEKIRMLTQRNNHTMARLELAKLVGSKQHMKFYQAIMDIQDVVGHLPMGLSKVRHEMEKPFMNLLKKKFSNFDIIYSVL